jgi:hypothetical protein
VGSDCYKIVIDGKTRNVTEGHETTLSNITGKMAKYYKMTIKIIAL